MIIKKESKYDILFLFFEIFFVELISLALFTVRQIKYLAGLASISILKMIIYLGDSRKEDE